MIISNFINEIGNTIKIKIQKILILELITKQKKK
jgi:hypothetical protein